VIAATGVVVLAALGVLHENPGSIGEAFDLDAEGTVPAYFSALVLAAAATGAGRLWLRDTRRLTVLGLSALLLLMAFDEVATLHEKLEDRTGIDWQLLYLPLILAAGIGWTAVVLRVRRELATVALMLAGGAAWAVSQVLEAVQWDAADQPVAAYTTLMVTEEVLEMVGSVALALGLHLAALHFRTVARDG
jgi:hypothetical protein